MTRVVIFDEFGGPDVLHVVDRPAPAPGVDELRVEIEAFAVDPLDLMMRSGISPAPVPLPGTRLGSEGTGLVDALATGVRGLLEVGSPVIITAIPDAEVNGSYIVATGSEDVATAVLEYAHGVGADVVLDLVTGPGQRNCSGPFVRVRLLSLRASSTSGQLRRPLIADHPSIPELRAHP